MTRASYSPGGTTSGIPRGAHEDKPGGGHTEPPGDVLRPALPAYAELTLGEFLAEVAAGHAPPAAGSVAAACVAMSASLCAMTARLSRRQLAAPVAAELAATAEELSAQAAALVQADAEAVSRALSATGESNADGMPAEAAIVPAQLLDLAVQVARLAARLAADGNPSLRGDAVSAVLLADGAAKSAAALVRIDLEAGPSDDPRLARTAALLAEAERLVAKVDTA